MRPNYPQPTVAPLNQMYGENRDVRWIHIPEVFPFPIPGDIGEWEWKLEWDFPEWEFPWFDYLWVSIPCSFPGKLLRVDLLNLFGIFRGHKSRGFRIGFPNTEQIIFLILNREYIRMFSDFRIRLKKIGIRRILGFFIWVFFWRKSLRTPAISVIESGISEEFWDLRNEIGDPRKIPSQSKHCLSIV